jgi:hypothetical protein
MLPAVPDVVIAPGVPANVRYGKEIAEVNVLSAAGLSNMDFLTFRAHLGQGIVMDHVLPVPLW